MDSFQEYFNICDWRSGSPRNLKKIWQFSGIITDYVSFLSQAFPANNHNSQVNIDFSAICQQYKIYWGS